MELTCRPLRDRIVIKPMDKEEITKGGIFLPDTADKGRPTEGTVMAVGSGRRNEKGDVTPLDVKKGDKVIFSEYAGTELKLDGVKYLIVRQDDVLAVC